MSIHGGVLSLFVKFSRTKNIKFVNIPIFGRKKNPRKIWKIEKNCVEKMPKIGGKNRSSPTRMTLIHGVALLSFLSNPVARSDPQQKKGLNLPRYA